jgi:hypothetical protein
MRRLMMGLALALAGGCYGEGGLPPVFPDAGPPDMERPRGPLEPRCSPFMEGIPCYPEEICCYCCTDISGARNCRLHNSC